MRGKFTLLKVICIYLVVKIFPPITALYKKSVTIYFMTRKQLYNYTEITVYVSVILVYFCVGIREQYVKFGVIKG